MEPSSRYSTMTTYGPLPIGTAWRSIETPGRSPSENYILGENSMRRILLTLASALMLVVISVATAGEAAAQQGVLSDTWTSVDTDGSNQVLRIRGSGEGAYAMSLFDDSATEACDGAPAMFVGSGEPDGTDLVMSGTLTCLPGGNGLRFRLTFGFIYDPTADTLTGLGVTWHRS